MAGRSRPGEAQARLARAPLRGSGFGPGVVDVSSAWTDLLPGPMRTQLESRARGARSTSQSRSRQLSRRRCASSRKPHGPETQFRYKLFRTIATYRVGDEVARVTTPLLITDPLYWRFWPGQSRQLHDRLPGPKALIRLTSERRAPATASRRQPPDASPASSTDQPAALTRRRATATFADPGSDP